MSYLKLLLILMFLPSLGFAYTLDGSTVLINDSKVLISATPHTLTQSGYVEVNLTSKIYTGDINVVLGVNHSILKPKSIEIYDPHNVTVQKSFTCNLQNYFYNYTTTPKHFWCWSNATYNNITYTNLVFEHAFDEANLSIDTAYWNETYIEDWRSLDNIVDNKINYVFDNKTLWYYASNVPIVSNVTYRTRLWMDVPVSFTDQGKYDLAFYPSSYGSDIQQANQDNKLYYLDPWWDSSWGACVNVTSSSNATESGWFTHVLPINSTNINHSKVQSGGIDIRVVPGNCSTPNSGATYLPQYIQHYESSGISFLYFNSTANQKYFALYYNNSAASDVSDIRGVSYAADTGDLSVNDTVTSNGQLLTGNGGWSNDFTSEAEFTYSTTLAFSGSVSMLHDGSTGGARSYFNPSLSPSMTIEFWLYDTSTDSNGVLMLNKDNPEHSGSDKGWNGVFAEAGGALTSNYAYYNGAWTSSGHPRSTGWHKFIIKTDGTTLNLYDANLTSPYETFITNITQSVSAVLPTIDSRSETNAYFDDVIVRPYSLNDNTYTFSAEETSTSDTTAPQFSLNQTNTTAHDSNATISVFWTDETALDSYRFEYCSQWIIGQGCSATQGWETSDNFSFGDTGWVNFTKILNTTTYFAVITWANDTSGNSNQSGGTTCTSKGSCDIYLLTGLTYSRLVTDTSSISDSDLRNYNALRIYDDITSLSDLSKNNYTARRISADTVVLTDSAKRSFTATRIGSESMTFSDLTGRTFMARRILSNVVVVVDATNREVHFIRLGTDEALIIDSTGRFLTGTRLVSDSTVLSDAIFSTKVLHRAISDSVILSELSTRTATFSRTLSDVFAFIESLFTQGGITVNVTTPPGNAPNGFTNYEFLLQAGENIAFDRLDIKVIEYNITNTKSQYGVFSPRCKGEDCQYIVLQQDYGIAPNQTIDTFFILRIPPTDLRRNYIFNITASDHATNSLHFNISLSEGLLIDLLKQKNLTLEDYDLVFKITSDQPVCAGSPLAYKYFILSNNLPTQQINVKARLTNSFGAEMTPYETTTQTVELNNAKEGSSSIDTRMNWDEGWYRLEGYIENYTNTTNTFFYLKDCSELDFEGLPILGNILDSIPIFLQRPIDIGAIKGLPFAYVFIGIGLISMFVVWLVNPEKMSSKLFWLFFIWIIVTGILWYLLP